MTRALERLLRLQRGDLPRGLLLFAYLFLVICAYLIGQVARDSLFLGRFDASLLPFADMSLFLVVALVVAFYVRAGRRLSLDRLIAGSLVAFGFMGLAFAALARLTPPPAWLFPVVYVWVGVLGVLAPAQVWTLANYVLTSREARRMFGFVGAGATLGATVGGFLSSVLARRFGAESLLEHACPFRSPLPLSGTCTSPITARPVRTKPCCPGCVCTQPKTICTCSMSWPNTPMSMPPSTWCPRSTSS